MRNEDETIQYNTMMESPYNMQEAQENALGRRDNSGCAWMVEDGRRNVQKCWEPKKPTRKRDSKSPEQDGGHGARWSAV